MKVLIRDAALCNGKKEEIKRAMIFNARAIEYEKSSENSCSQVIVRVVIDYADYYTLHLDCENEAAVDKIMRVLDVILVQIQLMKWEILVFDEAHVYRGLYQEFECVGEGFPSIDLITESEEE